jgi:hypothetical protein
MGDSRHHHIAAGKTSMLPVIIINEGMGEGKVFLSLKKRIFRERKANRANCFLVMMMTEGD